MAEQKTDTVEDDGDDVVIIGDVMPKPMASHNKQKPRRHVEYKKSKYKKGSLVITQKVKVKKQKYQCVLKQRKVNDSLPVEDSVKNNKCENPSELKDKCERYAPICMRKTCKDTRCKVGPKSGRNNDSRRSEREKRPHYDFPRDLKRMLSPVSPSPLERDLSFDLDISYDTSSLQEMKESKLDTLIKRTRDRERKNQMIRTQHLCTPPPANLPNEDKTEDKKMSNTTDYNLPYTSTPIYEENQDKQSSIGSNNITESKIDNNTSFENIHFMFSPINSPGVSISKSINCKKQVSQCISPLLKDTNSQDTRSESVNVASSNISCEQNMADTTIRISNNIKEQVSNDYMFCKDIQISNKISEHVQSDVSNINREYNIFSNKMPTCNNTKPLIGQRPFLDDQEIQRKTSDHIESVVPNNHEQKTSNRMSTSDIYDKDKINKICSPSLENTQIIQKKSQYTQTVNFNTNYEQSVEDTRMHVSNTDEPLNKCSFTEQIQQQNSDIQTIVTNTNGLMIDDGKLDICNNENVLFFNNQFFKNVLNEKSDPTQTISLPHNEQNIDNNAQSTTKLSSFYISGIQTQNLPEMQTTISHTKNENNLANSISHTKNENNLANSHFSMSHSNNNVNKQVCTANSLLSDNIKNRKIQHSNTVTSNMNHENNLEEIDMSISYDNDDNFAEYPFTHSFTYEDTHLQHRPSENDLQTAIENMNYANINHFNPSAELPTNNKQLAENSQMLFYYNSFTGPQNIFPNPFFNDKQKSFNVFHSFYEQNNNFNHQPHFDSKSFENDIHAQNIKYDNNINSIDSNYNEQKNDDREKQTFYNNYSEQRNRSHCPFFEESDQQEKFDRNQEQDINRKRSLFNDSNLKEQQDSFFFKDINKQHFKYDHTFTKKSNNKHEQTRNESDPIFYRNNFKEQQNKRYSQHSENRHNNIDYNYSAYSNRKHEEIKNKTNSSNKNSSNEHQNRYRSRFSKNFHEQQSKSDFICTSHTVKHYEQKVDNRDFEEPARRISPFVNGVHSQQKSYKCMRTDNSRNTYEKKIDDRDISTSYKNYNFREKPFKCHSPFSYDSNKKSKFMHSNNSNQYYEQKIEERKISITNKNIYVEDKRNKSYNARENRHKLLQHRKSVYNAVYKKKVEIFIDKRMNDEAYEDVCVGLPPGRVSPDMH